MATRVNTRFVVILSSVILLIVMALVGVYVLKVMRSPEERIRKAEVYLAEGDLRSAADQLGRALAKRMDDLELIRKYESVITRIPTKDHVEANQYLSQIMQTKVMASDLRPNDPHLLEEYYSFLVDLDAWGRIYDQASAKLQQYPDNLVARRYRGMANTRLISAEMPLSRQKQAAEDLLAVYEKDPKDAEVAYHLALWNLKEASRLEDTAARAEEVQKHRDFAVELAKRMYEQDPQELKRQLRYVQVLLHPDIGNVETARPIVDALETQLHESPTPDRAVMAMVEALPRVDAERVPREGKPTTTRGLQRAQALLTSAVEKQPENVLFRTMLGRVLSMQGDQAAAIEQFAAAWAAAEEKPPVDAVKAHGLQISAAQQQMNLEVSQTDQIADPAAREAELARIEARVGEIENLVGPTGETHLIRGKIAMARRKPGVAMQHLRQATQNLGGTMMQIESLVLAARAYQLGDEPGAARDALEQALQLNPGMLPVRLELAKLLSEFRQPAEAQAHIDFVLANDPDNEQAMALQAQLLARAGKFDQAITAFEKAGGGARPERLLGMAELQLRAGNRDEAVRLLRARLAAEPGDLRALGMAVRLIEDPAEREALFTAAREGGANSTLIDVLERQASGEGDIDQQALIEQLLEQQEDPLRRALAEVMLYRQTGDQERADEALRRASELGPDDPQVIELQFVDAIGNQEWQRADQLASQAGTLNLDLANGGFYRARLAAAQQRYDEAVAEYRRALSAREVYSDGWRQLGEVQLRAGNPEAARDAFRRALDQQPNSVAAVRGLVAVADRQGQHQTALRLLRDAVERGAARELLTVYLAYEQQHGDPQRALAYRQQIAEQNPRDTDNRRAMAVLLAHQERYDEAIATLDAVMAEEGVTRQNVSTLASIHGMKGDADAGREAIADFIASRGEEATAADLLVLARFDLAAGDLDRAMSTYARARQTEDPELRPITRELADLLFSAGRNEQAASLYRELYEQNPNDPVVGLRFAETLMRSGEVDEAEKIVAAHPDSAQAKMLEAVLAMRDQDRETAIAALERALQLDAGNATALVQLANLLADDPAQRTRAKQLLLDAVRANPESMEARVALADMHVRLREIPDAVRELGVALDQQPGNANLRLRLVDLHADRGNLPAARTLLNEAERLQPENPVWPRLLGRIEASRGNYAEATQAAARVVERVANPETVATLAVYQVRSGRATAALATLEAHPQMLNTEPVLQGVRGWALAATDQADEARRVFARAIERSQSLGQVNSVTGHLVEAMGRESAAEQLAAAPTPANPVWVQLALADLELKGGEAAAAVKRLRALAPQLPDEDTPERQAYGQVLPTALYQAGEYAEARAAYEQMLELRPDDVGTLNNLAYLLVENLNEAEAGLRLAERAATLLPGNAQVLDTLGWALFKTGDLSRARQTLEESLRLEPIAPAAYHLARVYEAQAAIPQARQYANQAIELAEQAGDDAVLSQAKTLLEQLNQNAAAVRQ